MSNRMENSPLPTLPDPIKSLIFWGVVLFWLLAFTATHVPSYSHSSTGGSRLPIDKIVHFTMYACLATGLLLILWTRTTVSLKTCLAVFLCLACYGAVDELTQSFIPGRYADLYDWYADCIGTIVGISFSLGAFKILSVINRKTPKVELNRS
ncbi:MAG: hypothetical protein COA78_07375 [Blastopirellula sp.]|nr:MAG: hypothetical protein COA78_07375 [Blastopirellula sp.]